MNMSAKPNHLVEWLVAGKTQCPRKYTGGASGSLWQLEKMPPEVVWQHVKTTV